MEIYKKQNKKQYHSKDWLYDQFIILNKSISKVAKEQGTSHSTISYFLKKFKIKKPKPKYQDKEWLFQQYIKLDKTQEQIANLCKVGQWTISKWLNKYKIPIKQTKKREKSHRWKGGIIRTKDGYIGIYKPNHPRADPTTGYVFEHILEVEKKIGRTVKKNEIIHHIDENKGNNIIANLFVCKNQKEHQKIHQQLAQVAIQLYNLNVIKFDANIGKYYLDLTRIKERINGNIRNNKKKREVKS